MPIFSPLSIAVSNLSVVKSTSPHHTNLYPKLFRLKKIFYVGNVLCLKKKNSVTYPPGKVNFIFSIVINETYPNRKKLTNYIVIRHWYDNRTPLNINFMYQTKLKIVKVFFKIWFIFFFFALSFGEVHI